MLCQGSGAVSVWHGNCLMSQHGVILVLWRLRCNAVQGSEGAVASIPASASLVEAAEGDGTGLSETCNTSSAWYPTTNLALGRPASFSSAPDTSFAIEDSYHVASRAVDGDYTNAWYSAGCASTTLEAHIDPTWEVTLAAEHYIRNVRILNRDTLGERLDDFTITVSGSQGASHCGQHLVVPTNQMGDFICDPPGTNGVSAAALATAPVSQLLLPHAVLGSKVEISLTGSGRILTVFSPLC